MLAYILMTSIVSVCDNREISISVLTTQVLGNMLSRRSLKLNVDYVREYGIAT